MGDRIRQEYATHDLKFTGCSRAAMEMLAFAMGGWRKRLTQCIELLTE
jgi:hypothetical protein